MDDHDYFSCNEYKKVQELDKAPMKVQSVKGKNIIKVIYLEIHHSILQIKLHKKFKQFSTIVLSTVQTNKIYANKEE